MFVCSYTMQAQDTPPSQVKPASQSEAKSDNVNGRKNMPKTAITKQKGVTAKGNPVVVQPKGTVKGKPGAAKGPDKMIRDDEPGSDGSNKTARRKRG